MIIHILLIFLMVAVVASFLILWYLWARRRVEIAFSREGVSEALFPFRYFSWIMIAVITATCIAQIHFIRVSSTVHEKLAGMSEYLQDKQTGSTEIAELKTSIERLRTEIDNKFDRFHAKTFNSPVNNNFPEPEDESEASKSEENPGKALMSLAKADAPGSKPDFAREARASSANRARTLLESQDSKSNKTRRKVYSLALNLTGKVTASSLNVRKRPERRSPVIDKLLTGRQVKVTEKRIINDQMWYRIITSSGKAGWVDFRYLKINVASGSST